jgi:hypothetical protein
MSRAMKVAGMAMLATIMLLAAMSAIAWFSVMWFDLAYHVAHSKSRILGYLIFVSPYALFSSIVFAVSYDRHQEGPK